MHAQPHQITILRESLQSNSFTVVTQDFNDCPTYEHLAFDEMLGWIARTFCPTMSDGTPNRAAGKPLFLPAPKLQKSDAMSLIADLVAVIERANRTDIGAEKVLPSAKSVLRAYTGTLK
jgi:hypothetical protein